MSVTLNWSFNLDDEDETRIYRATSPIDENVLPAALATAPAGTRTYIDETTEDLTVYHYRFGKVKGTEEIISDEKVVFSSSYRGPGPQELVAGSYANLGLFGEVSEDEFFTAQELSNLLDYHEGYVWQDRQHPWLKVFHDGKIKYIRSAPVRANISWSGLYQAGLVFGTPGAHETEVSADIIAAIGAHDQEQVISLGLDRFRVSLMRGLADTGEWVVGNNDVERNGAEFNQIIYPLHALQEVGGLNNRAVSSRRVDFGREHLLCQETQGTQAIYRNSQFPTQAGSLTYDEQFGHNAWFPVIEYLPNY